MCCCRRQETNTASSTGNFLKLIEKRRVFQPEKPASSKACCSKNSIQCEGTVYISGQPTAKVCFREIRCSTGKGHSGFFVGVLRSTSGTCFPLMDHMWTSGISCVFLFPQRSREKPINIATREDEGSQVIKHKKVTWKRESYFCFLRQIFFFPFTGIRKWMRREKMINFGLDQGS